MCPFHIHIILQVIDGLFTYAGVRCLGIGMEVEGNPLIKSLMYAIGPGTALVAVKGLAIVTLLYVKRASRELVMLGKLISRINLLYMLSAALWAYVFMK
jgi:hypothetical protein